MKFVPIAIAAALVCGSALAQAPDAAQRAENRAKAGELVDKATPGPAQRAENRAKAGEVLDKATPGPAQRAENRAKAGEVADKATPGPAQRAKNRAKAAEVADKATPDAGERAQNRAKVGNVAEKGIDGAKRAGQATKRGVGRAAEVTGDVTRNAASKVRNTGEAIARKLPPAPAERGMADARDGRTAMGAGPAVNSASADGADDSRRQRMDDAYGNWQRQAR
jgi:hypothetical protein